MRKNKVLCQVDGCTSLAAWKKDKRSPSGGYYRKADGVVVCAAHENKWTRYKDFSVSRMWVRKQNKPIVTYGGAHIRLKREKGSAKEHPCTACGSTAQEWALSQEAKSTLFGTHGKFLCEYSLDPNDYIPMCSSCHRSMDIKQKREKSNA